MQRALGATASASLPQMGHRLERRVCLVDHERLSTQKWPRQFQHCARCKTACGSSSQHADKQHYNSEHCGSESRGILHQQRRSGRSTAPSTPSQFAGPSCKGKPASRASIQRSWSIRLTCTCSAASTRRLDQIWLRTLPVTIINRNRRRDRHPPTATSPGIDISEYR